MSRLERIIQTSIKDTNLETIHTQQLTELKKQQRNRTNRLAAERQDIILSYDDIENFCSDLLTSLSLLPQRLSGDAKAKQRVAEAHRRSFGKAIDTLSDGIYFLKYHKSDTNKVIRITWERTSSDSDIPAKMSEALKLQKKLQAKAQDTTVSQLSQLERLDKLAAAIVALKLSVSEAEYLAEKSGISSRLQANGWNRQPIPVVVEPTDKERANNYLEKKERADIQEEAKKLISTNTSITNAKLVENARILAQFNERLAAMRR